MLLKKCSLITGLFFGLTTSLASAATQAITAQWNAYAAPAGYTVIGYKLYQENTVACQNTNPSATSMDCTVSLTTDTTNFSLTAIFSDGSESPHSTVVTYTKPAVALNAVISASATSGTAPLALSFNGSSSTGTIVSYVWNFGDGGTATGSTATHTFTTSGTYTVQLTVKNSQGLTSTTSTAVTVNAAQQQTPAIAMEAGEISVSSAWVHVNFHSTFSNPIVVVGPPRSNDSAPCVARIRNVTKTGFDVRLSEWNYLDGIHTVETVDYLVVEKGRTTLPDGSIMLASSFSGTTTAALIRFGSTFNKTPVVLTTVASVNNSKTISGRVNTVSTTGFRYNFREQESNTSAHAAETINFIAIEPSKGTIGSVQYEVRTATANVTSNWTAQTFQSSFSQTPLILADMQTVKEIDTSELRLRTVNPSYMVLKVEEEQSADTETTHIAETVGYLVLNASN